MSQETRCDRCGKALSGHVILEKSGYYAVVVDLCHGCLMAFNAFMELPKTEKQGG